MRYALVFADGQTARNALEFLGSGNLAGQLEGNRLLFDTLQYAHWAQGELEAHEIRGRSKIIQLLDK